MRWKVWYADETEYTSKDCSFEDLPVQGLVIAKAFLETKKVIASGTDAIYFDPNADPCFIGVNLPTPEFQRAAEIVAEQTRRLKFGQFLSNEVYERIYNKAKVAQWQE